MEMRSEMESMFFFERARLTAEAAYATDPLDADNLTRWGGALLELAQFQNGPEAKKMIHDAISKLEEALSLNPSKHDAHWCLGNAHTAFAFFISDQNEANECFKKAAANYQKAAEQDPGNDLYTKSLEIAAKAPLIHMKVQQQADAAEASTSSRAKTTTKKKTKDSDLKYDIMGWVILAVGVVAWVGFAKSHMPAPPSPS